MPCYRIRVHLNATGPDVPIFQLLRNRFPETPRYFRVYREIRQWNADPRIVSGGNLDLLLGDFRPSIKVNSVIVDGSEERSTAVGMC